MSQSNVASDSVLGADEIQLHCHPQVFIETGERRCMVIVAFTRENNMNTYIGPWKSYLYLSAGLENSSFCKLKVFSMFG